MLDSLKVVNKQLGAYGSSDHYDLWSHQGKNVYVITVPFSPFAMSEPPTHYPIETHSRVS